MKCLYKCGSSQKHKCRLVFMYFVLIKFELVVVQYIYSLEFVQEKWWLAKWNLNKRSGLGPDIWI